ncbi:AAA family ATPase [Streptomyces sp. NPDC050161]|uniref:AAA family ATPase n=1 Tax=Streptomyces sp. NPDC050161 TaxID=3365604 RepID=UPI0037B16515
MAGTEGAGAADSRAAASPAPDARPQGLRDLRAADTVPATLSYPPGAVVVVSGLPGSGKSTLLHRWSAAADVAVIDPRTVHVACEAVMPGWLPYAVYRPWARARLLLWLRAELGGDRPLLVHDCGSRPWLRRLLAWCAARRGRTLHLVVLDVGAAVALSGQRARDRWVRRRVFARHCRGLGRLLAALPPAGTRSAAALPASLADAASVVLLDAASRAQVRAARFTAAGALPKPCSGAVSVPCAPSSEPSGAAVPPSPRSVRAARAPRR